MLNKLLTLFFIITTPIQKIMQKLRKPEPKMTTAQIEVIINHCESGDVLLCNESYHFTNWFIPSPYDHAAIIYLNINTDEKLVIESVAEGVGSVDLVKWLYEKDNVILLRRLHASPESRHGGAMWAKSMIGKLAYDTEFRKLRKNSKVKSTYCARFVCDALNIPYHGVVEPVELVEMPSYLDLVCKTVNK